MNKNLNRAAWVEIDLGAITENFRMLSALAPNSETIVCVKADAYGHGLIPVSEALLRAGADALGVATPSEAQKLRDAGITAEIVLYGAPPRNSAAETLKLKVIPIISTFEDAKALSDAANTGPAEIFIAADTGMGRLGFLPAQENYDEISKISKLPNIKIKGLFSHLATADEDDSAFTLSQISRFEKFAGELENRGIAIEKRTIANSAAIMKFSQAHYEIVRPGISLYGYMPSPAMDKTLARLKPALSVKAQIVYLRKVPAGYSIGYGRKWTAERESLIGTIPIGYGDGLSRNLTGKAKALVRGKFAPIVGTICMDQCMLDLTDIEGASEYDEVTLLGADGASAITADDMAESAGTISYEILTRFAARLPRIYL